MSKELKDRVNIFGARVLIKEDKNDGETSSGIILPGQEKQETFKGTVIAVGDGAILEDGTKVPMKVNVGDRVIYTCYSGVPIKVKSEEEVNYIIVNERDVLMAIEE